MHNQINGNGATYLKIATKRDLSDFDRYEQGLVAYIRDLSQMGTTVIRQGNVLTLSGAVSCRLSELPPEYRY